MNERLAEFLSIRLNDISSSYFPNNRLWRNVEDMRTVWREEWTDLESEDVIGENNDLVPARFVVIDQILTGLDLVWVHRV